MHNFCIFSFHPPFHISSIVLHLLLFPRPFTFSTFIPSISTFKVKFETEFNLNLSTRYSTYLNFTFTLLSFQLNDNHLRFILYYYIYRTTKEFICPSFTFCVYTHPCLHKRNNKSYSFQSHISHELSSNSTVLIPRAGKKKQNLPPPFHRLNAQCFKSEDNTARKCSKGLPPSSIFTFTPASKRTALLQEH